MYDVVNRGYKGMKNNTPTGSLFSPEFREVVKRLKRKDQLIDEMVRRDEDKPEESTEKGAQGDAKRETPET
jgi:hypothetical protein